MNHKHEPRFFLSLILFSAVCFCAGCAGDSQKKVASAYSDFYIIGENEKVALSEHKIVYKARIDTGATTCSLNAANIVEFVRDGKKWARFDLYNAKAKETITLEKPISRIASIKRHGTEDQRRVAVKLPIKLGPVEDVVEFTLTDRSKFEYPALIGRNFLSGNVLVDSNLSYTGGIPIRLD